MFDSKNMEYKEKAKDWPQICTIIAASIPALTFGMLFAWPSPATIQLMSKDGEFRFTLEQCSYFNVISAASSMIATPIFGKLCDTVGRKYTMLTMTVTQSAAFLLAAFAKNIYVFYASRVFSGLSDACIFVAIPAYLGEIATPNVRDAWGNTFGLYSYWGQVIISAIAGYTTIRDGALISLTFPLLFAAAFPFMPESPYYLVMKDRKEEACKALQKLLRLKNVDTQLKQLEADVSRQMSERGTWKELFTVRSNRKALFAGAFLRCAQQLAGLSVFSVYSEYIFSQAGGNLSATNSAIIFLGACALGVYMAGYLFNRIGKIRALKFSSISSALVLATIGVYFYVALECPQFDLSNFRWVPLAGLLVYVPLFSVGLGIAPTFMLTELFSASIKGKALCALTIFYGFLQCSITKLFQVLEVNFGMYTPFGLFAVCTFSSAFLVDYFVPETKGMTLEEIQQQLKGKKKAES